MQDNSKLVVVTREDLSPGYQAVQSAHAAIDFTFEHPNRAGPWHKISNYLILLSLKNEKQLKLLIKNCERLELVYTAFREPDIGNAITAVAIEPSEITQKLVSKIPLLFKDKIIKKMNKNNNIASKTMAIKARVYNQIRTDLYKKQLEENYKTKYQKETVITPKEKVELFDKWFSLNSLAHQELNAYKAKRKWKREIYEARVARGYKFKKKQSKEERQKYLAESK